MPRPRRRNVRKRKEDFENDADFKEELIDDPQIKVAETVGQEEEISEVEKDKSQEHNNDQDIENEEENGAEEQNDEQDHDNDQDVDDDDDEEEGGGKEEKKVEEDGEQPVKKRRGRPRKYERDSDGIPIIKPTPQAKKKRIEETSFDLDAEISEEETDPKGDEKIDIDGNLQGGRQLVLRTIILPRHPSRRYVLTTEVSKLFGFRDSYIYFQKNSDEPRYYATDEDKEFLHEHNWIQSQFRTRPILITPVRHLFRKYGFKVILNGIPIRDDYFVGDRKEGDVMDVDTSFNNTRVYDFRVSNPSAIQNTRQVVVKSDPSQRVNPVIKRKLQLQSCLSASNFNRRMLLYRESRFHDLHTNIEMIDLSKQAQGYQILVDTSYHGNELNISTDPINTADEKNNEPHVNKSCLKPIDHHPQMGVYPLAILPNQHQCSFSIYPSRFSQKDAQAAAEKLAAKAAEARSKDAPFDPESTINLDAMDIDEKQTTEKRRINLDQNKIQELLSTTCGEITMKGRECSRAVAFPGDKCAQHDPYRMGECVMCKQVEAPVNENNEQKEEENQSIPKTLMITCALCKTRHHPVCLELDDIVLISKLQQYEWHCPSCKLCSICDDAGDESKLLFCDTCDRGYHMYCLDPPLEKLPEGQWLCKQCAKCTSCEKTTLTPATPSRGRRSASEMNPTWKHAILPAGNEKILDYYLCTYCPDCFKSYESGYVCPICMTTYQDEDEELAMVCCDQCDRWVHVGCEAELDEERYKKLTEDSTEKYTCTLCDDKKLAHAIYKRKKELESYTYKIITLIEEPSADNENQDLKRIRVVVPALTDRPEETIDEE